MKDLNILCIDLSTDFIILGACKKDKNIFVEKKTSKNTSEILWPILSQVFLSLKLKPSQLHCIGIGLGPGSFTGLRIALSIAKAFNVSLNIPVVGVSTFDIIAHSLDKTPLCVCRDAKKNLFYVAVYEKSKTRIVKKMKESLLDISQLKSILKNEALYLCTDAWDLLIEKGLNIKKEKVLSSHLCRPRASKFLEICKKRFLERKFKEDAQKIKPLYLHSLWCQVK